MDDESISIHLRLQEKSIGTRGNTPLYIRRNTDVRIDFLIRAWMSSSSSLAHKKREPFDSL